MDSLCRKYNIDLSERNIHGALKDAKLLASVYLELIGGKQSKLEFTVSDNIEDQIKHDTTFDVDEYYLNLKEREIKRVSINKEDLQLHLNTIKNIKNSIWGKLII